jgi:hypothetical protein
MKNKYLRFFFMCLSLSLFCAILIMKYTSNPFEIGNDFLAMFLVNAWLLNHLYFPELYDDTLSLQLKQFNELNEYNRRCPYCKEDGTDYTCKCNVDKRNI